MKNTQKELLDARSEEIVELRGDINDLVSEESALKLSLNDFQQYGRRNSLRFVNMKLSTLPDKNDRDDRERQLTTHMVDFYQRYRIQIALGITLQRGTLSDVTRLESRINSELSKFLSNSVAITINDECLCQNLI